MDDMRNFDFEGYAAQAPLRRLRQAAAAYLLTAIELYLKIEGRVSVWNDLRFGDSANVVCCLNRAIEHLLKLRLLQIRPSATVSTSKERRRLLSGQANRNKKQ